VSVTTGRPTEESRLGEEGLVFFGRVTAGQCHELVNVLNIVNELSGLQEDTLPRAREGHAAALDRLGDLATRIQAQVKRGMTIIRHLSQFAHSVDEPWLRFDARAVIERVVFFAGRQARLRQTELVSDLPDESVALEGNPFRLQQAVYLGIELLLEEAAGRHRIAVTLTPQPTGVTVTLEGAGPAPRGEAAAGRLAGLTAILGALGGEAREAPRDAVDDRIVLFVPHAWRGDASPDAGAAGSGGGGGGG
jgi:hypothetical protein